MSKLILDINDRIEAAADDRARGVIIRKLRRALERRRPAWRPCRKRSPERTLAAIFDRPPAETGSAEARRRRRGWIGCFPIRLLYEWKQTKSVTQRPADTGVKTLVVQRATYWWVWIGFALAMSLLTPKPAGNNNEPGAVAPAETSAPAAAADHKSMPMPIAQSR